MEKSSRTALQNSSARDLVLPPCGNHTVWTIVHHKSSLPRSNFSDFVVKYGKEEQFKAVEKMRDHEQLFLEYLLELKKASKMRDEHHKQAAKSKAEKVGEEGGRREGGRRVGGTEEGGRREREGGGDVR